MDPAISSIFGTPTSNRLKTPVDGLAKIVNSLSLQIPDTNHLEKFEQEFITQLTLSVTGAGGDTNVEVETKREAATEWLLRTRRDSLYQWRQAEFYIAGRVNNGVFKETSEMHITTIVQRFFGYSYSSHVQARLRQFSPYKVSEEVVDDYIRGIKAKYEAKVQGLMETALRFKEQFGEGEFARLIL